MSTQYKAEIEFTAYEDDYNEGESLSCDNRWIETITADTQAELRNKILEATYSKWSDLDDEQINEYDWCTEYATGYTANESNEGEATQADIEDWKNGGNTKVWAIHCHILVTKVTESKASL